MTPIQLLESLEEFIKVNTKDIILQVRHKAGSDEVIERAPDVYKMRLPDKDSETKQIPYILIQVLTGKDTQEVGDTPDSECKVRIIFATYSEDGGVGALDVLNLLTRVRIALLKVGVVGEQFLLKKPLEYMVYQEDTAPYYFGEMMTAWEMPIIEREVDLHGEIE